MKRYLSTLLLALVLLTGLALLLYPTVSNLWNRRTQSRAVAAYQQVSDTLSQQDASGLLSAAEDYNQALRQQSPQSFYHPELVSGYEDTLDVTGTGIMGYITIQALNLELPIYHGTNPEVLQVAVGHLEGSSLPTGGAGTHCVISAHRGLPSARLFTDLDQLELGDTFTLTVVDRLLTYQVDQILVVEPDQVDALQIVDGMDYCTLMTCTPYGVNSHRLLVRGVRIADQAPAVQQITGEARSVSLPAAGVVMAVLGLAAVLVLTVNYPRKPKKR